MRNIHRNPLSSGLRQSERGSISIPLALLISIVTGASLLSVSYAILWKSRVALQLRLDRCVESTALELEKIQTQIESSNLRMTLERVAALAAAVPSAGASLKAAKPILLAEEAIQEGLRMKWRLKQSTWIARRGCDGKRDLFLPLPDLGWWRPPEDPLGPRPLERERGRSAMKIHLWKMNRKSVAEVFERNADATSKESNSRRSRWANSF